MSWPKGRARPKKVGSVEQEAIDLAESAEMVNVPREPNQPPADWRKGAMINVRNMGSEVVITLWPEEARPEHPERALRFTNFGEAQSFVSAWYASEHHDPRAR